MENSDNEFYTESRDESSATHIRRGMKWKTLTQFDCHYDENILSDLENDIPISYSKS